MSKEMYFQEFEKLFNEQFDKQPQKPPQVENGYDKLGDLAYDRYRERFAGLIDDARQKAKYGET